MDFSEYAKAKLGWSLLHKLITHLGSLDSKMPVIYLFETHELVITDTKLLEYLNYLGLEYTLHQPPNAIVFISKI